MWLGPIVAHISCVCVLCDAKLFALRRYVSSLDSKQQQQKFNENKIKFKRER